MSIHNICSLGNKENVNFWASKSWLDKWIFDYLLVSRPEIQSDNSTALHNVTYWFHFCFKHAL